MTPDICEQGLVSYLQYGNIESSFYMLNQRKDKKINRKKKSEKGKDRDREEVVRKML